MRCWFAPEDLKIGAEIRTGIDESILVHDKLLLVLSETSVKSQWVQQEVETALAKEREQGRTVLFPIWSRHKGRQRTSRYQERTLNAINGVQNAEGFSVFGLAHVPA